MAVGVERELLFFDKKFLLTSVYKYFCSPRTLLSVRQLIFSSADSVFEVQKKVKWYNNFNAENALLDASHSKFDPGILRGVK